MAPAKNFWICKRVANDDKGVWPHKLCNGTNFLSNTACRFCDGARPTSPPWADKAAGSGKGKGKSGQAGSSASPGKGKGKGKGKHSGKSASPSEPEHLSAEVWSALTKDQRRRYRAGRLTKQDAVQLAKLGCKATPPPGQAKSVDDMVTEEELADEEGTDIALTKRDFQVTLSGFFDAVVEPRPQNKERSAEEALCTLLTKGARASAEAAEKTQRITALNSAIAATTCKFAKVALMEKMEELQKQLDEISPEGGDQASAASEKLAYCKARDKLDTDRVNKREYREKKTVEMEQNSHSFMAAVAEARAQLAQLESEFLQRRDTAREKWAQTNAESDKLADEMRVIACARIDAAEKKINEKKTTVRTLDTTAVGVTANATGTGAQAQSGASSGVGSTSAAEDAAAAEEARIRENVVRQLEARKEVQQEHLRSFQKDPLTPEELPTAHLMWNWAKGVEFEDPMLPYTYAMIGVTGENLAVFLGKAATDLLFTVASSPMDVVPMQVRGLIAYQLRMLEQQKTLSTADATTFEAQAKEAKASLKKHLPALKESRRAGMRHVKK